LLAPFTSLLPSRHSTLTEVLPNYSEPRNEMAEADVRGDRAGPGSGRGAGTHTTARATRLASTRRPHAGGYGATSSVWWPPAESAFDEGGYLPRGELPSSYPPFAKNANGAFSNPCLEGTPRSSYAGTLLGLHPPSGWQSLFQPCPLNGGRGCRQTRNGAATSDLYSSIDLLQLKVAEQLQAAVL
jgi:hypothetical protein